MHFIRPDSVMRWLKVRSQTFLVAQATRGIRCTVGGAQDITDRKTARPTASVCRTLTQAQKMESVGRLAGGVARPSAMLGGSAVSRRHCTPGRAPGEFDDIRRAAPGQHVERLGHLEGIARRQVVAPKILDLNSAVSALLGMLRRLIGEDIELGWAPSPDAGRVRIDPSQVDQVLTNLAANARDAIQGVGRVTVRTGDAAGAADLLRHEGAIAGPRPLKSATPGEVSTRKQRRTCSTVFTTDRSDAVLAWGWPRSTVS
jgi:hypothetical protein